MIDSTYLYLQVKNKSYLHCAIYMHRRQLSGARKIKSSFFVVKIMKHVKLTPLLVVICFGLYVFQHHIYVFQHHMYAVRTFCRC